MQKVTSPHVSYYISWSASFRVHFISSFFLYFSFYFFIFFYYFAWKVHTFHSLCSRGFIWSRRTFGNELNFSTLSKTDNVTRIICRSIRISRKLNFPLLGEPFASDRESRLPFVRSSFEPRRFSFIL